MNTDWLIYPNNNLKITWDVFILFLLIWTATVVPYNIAFLPYRPNIWVVVDLLMDICWFIDIVLIFFTAIKIPGTNRYIINKRDIAYRYIRGWFTLDVITTIPWSLIEYFTKSGGGGSLRLLRLFRTLRLVRAFKVFQFFKIIKFFLEARGKKGGFIDQLTRFPKYV
jgi:hypothetical protein